jgi:hypothetical protein
MIRFGSFPLVFGAGPGWGSPVVTDRYKQTNNKFLNFEPLGTPKSMNDSEIRQVPVPKFQGFALAVRQPMTNVIDPKSLYIKTQIQPPISNAKITCLTLNCLCGILHVENPITIRPQWD